MSDFKDNMYEVRLNPALMTELALAELERQLDGEGSYDIPDASNPFAWAMELSTLQTSMGLNEAEAICRRLYPRMALTVDELYYHMSDDDYSNRFATPAWTPFEIYLPMDEVIKKAVLIEDTGIRKLVIPRLTSIKVAGHTFTMQFPIELKVMAHGGLQVVYDGDVSSPIQVLESNMVDWQPVNTSRMRLMQLKVPMGQFEVTTVQEALNAASAYDTTFSFPDQFYYARVYVNNDGSGWKEIRTTHTDQVYDPMTLTAVLKVSNGKLRVSIPLIYNTAGMMEGTIRVDIYTTKGKIDLDLGSYQNTQFVINFNDIDDDLTFVSPLNTLSMTQALNPTRVTGGSNSVSFEDLRSMVIDNTLGTSKVPITNVQLENSLYQKGYTLVTNIDNITNRQFLASRRLAPPTNGSTIAGAACMMAQLQVSMEQLAASTYVNDNGERITILPDMLYVYKDGKVTTVDDASIRRLLGSSSEAKARASLESRYLYTPFHYVLDASESNFDVRPYYFDQPKIIRKAFVAENDTAQLQAGVDTYSISRIAGGYRVTVKLKSGDQFKGIDDELVIVQLGYKPMGETQYASVNGTLVGLDESTKERIYQFDILTRFDVDAQNGLYTTNLSMYDDSQTNFAATLEQDFDISIIVTDTITPGYVLSDMDTQVQHHLLPANFMVVVRERLSVVLGYNLTALWRRNRSITSEASWATYSSDVPYYYEEDVYTRDSNGQIIIEYKEDGTLNYQIEHRKGDPVLDADGNQVMRYLKGDVILDANGKPQLIASRKILREITMFLVDGLYYFASEQSSAEYKSQLPMEVVGWLQNDVALVSKQLLEQCELYLYPTTTFGDTVARVKEGLNSTVTIDQAISISYYMSASAYPTTSIRPALIQSTKEIVNEMLGKKTVATSDIITRLKANAGDDVISIEVSGLGGDSNFPILTVSDDAVRLSLRKKLTVLANQELTVEDDIKINFLRHDSLS